ncbi:MAG: carboxypeptidase-like regulatory domain-containing protein [Bacteroidetes bacterium]|nr:carboxypeptidase-like regulatory domain-containing protein [Bacteroidota bacterium]
MKLLIFTILILLPTLFWGQNIYSGTVIDSDTKEPLPFVNIRIGSSQNGFTTDIDGIFEYESGGKIENFEFSYLGYEKLEQTLEVAVQNAVYLTKNSIGLEEVVVDADYNPALPIIKKVIRNRRSNNPEKNLDFYYES